MREHACVRRERVCERRAAVCQKRACMKVCGGGMRQKGVCAKVCGGIGIVALTRIDVTTFIVTNIRMMNDAAMATPLVTRAFERSVLSML